MNDGALIVFEEGCEGRKGMEGWAMVVSSVKPSLVATRQNSLHFGS